MSPTDSFDTEQRIQQAIDWHSLDPKNTVRQAALRYNLPNTTLQRRLKGGKSRIEASVANLLLSPAEEKTLADAVLSHADRDFPVRIRQLRSWANQILCARDPKASSIGIEWPSRFLRRYPDIQVRLRQTMDRVRVKAADPASIAAFFDLVREICYFDRAELCSHLC